MASNVLQGTYHWVDNGANQEIAIGHLTILNVNISHLIELVLLETSSYPTGILIPITASWIIEKLE